MLAIFQYQKLIDHALREDIGTGDLSTMIIPSDLMGQARIYAKENGVVCGIELVEAIFKRVDSRIEIESFINDGQNIEPGTIVME
ncbi:MAG: nicotinate-nucleotide diphosphorylase (carboxylating), partial [Eubacteriales bacterium]